MPNSNTKSISKTPKNNSVKKPMNHKSYGEMLDNQRDEYKKPFAGNEFYRLFGYQQKLKGGTHKKNKNRRKTYKRKCK